MIGTLPWSQLKQRITSAFAGVWAALFCALIAWLSHSWGDLAFFLMVYLLGAVVVAWRWGHLAATVAAVVGMLAHDFITGAHTFHLSVANVSRSLVFLGLVSVAQIVAWLVARLRVQKQAAEDRLRETTSLLTLSRLLSRAPTSQGIQQEAEAYLSAELGVPVTIHLPSIDRPMQVEPAHWPHVSQVYREACVQQIQMALARATSNEHAALAKAEADVERTRSSLLSAVSHDFRTPLAAISGASDVLAGEDATLSSEDRQELVEMIQLEARHLDHLVDNLLHMTRLEGGSLRLDRVIQPLEEVVGTTLTRLENRLGALPVRVEIPDDLPPIPLDSVLAEILITNLVENALRHAPGTPISLVAQAGPHAVTVDVLDQGPGIPREARERIFEKFAQQPGTSRDGGVGLGLAICKAIVHAHGGRIWVDDAPGGGAAFHVELPLGDGSMSPTMHDAIP